jgi:hypothetical protein
MTLILLGNYGRLRWNLLQLACWWKSSNSRTDVSYGIQPQPWLTMNKQRWLELFVKVLTRSTYFNRQDKIIALELISAILIFKDPSSLLWLRSYIEAMRLRYPQPACEPHLPRTPDLSVPSVASVVMFEHAIKIFQQKNWNWYNGYYRKIKTTFLSWKELKFTLFLP